MDTNRPKGRSIRLLAEIGSHRLYPVAYSQSFRLLLNRGANTAMANEDTKQVKQPKQPSAAPEVDRPVAPAVSWDDSDMRTSYANVVNASSTREEVTLFFGTNLTWNPTEAKELHIRLNDRVVLNPYAAKRLWMLLGAVLKQYESRFGELKLDAGGLQPSPPAGGRGGTVQKGVPAAKS